MQITFFRDMPTAQRAGIWLFTVVALCLTAIVIGRKDVPPQSLLALFFWALKSPFFPVAGGGAPVGPSPTAGPSLPPIFGATGDGKPPGS